MAYQLVYHHEIPDDLKNIPTNIKKRLRQAIETRLAIDPVGFGLPLRKSLSGYRKLRVGDYRIIYRIEGQTILILKIGHRRDVYPKMASRLNRPISPK